MIVMHLFSNPATQDCADMEHLTTLGLGWTNVNAIEVQEFDGDPPLCRVLMDFSRGEKVEEKG